MLSRRPLAPSELAHPGPAAWCFWGAQLVSGLGVWALHRIAPSDHEVDPLLSGSPAPAFWMIVGFLGMLGYLLVLGQFRISSAARRALWICSACAGCICVVVIWLVVLLAPAWGVEPSLGWTAGILIGSMIINAVVLWIASANRWIFSRSMDHICGVCGYDLRASEDRCPECGTAIAQTP